MCVRERESLCVCLRACVRACVCVRARMCLCVILAPAAHTIRNTVAYIGRDVQRVMPAEIMRTGTSTRQLAKSACVPRDPDSGRRGWGNVAKWSRYCTRDREVAGSNL